MAVLCTAWRQQPNFSFPLTKRIYLVRQRNQLCERRGRRTRRGEGGTRKGKQTTRAVGAGGVLHMGYIHMARLLTQGGKSSRNGGAPPRQ